MTLNILNKNDGCFKNSKPFLGYSEAVEGKSTLASMDIRFARTIERVQKIVCSELLKLQLYIYMLKDLKEKI
jgi:hypothetical protein